MSIVVPNVDIPSRTDRDLNRGLFILFSRTHCVFDGVEAMRHAPPWVAHTVNMRGTAGPLTVKDVVGYRPRSRSTALFVPGNISIIHGYGHFHE